MSRKKLQRLVAAMDHAREVLGRSTFGVEAAEETRAILSELRAAWPETPSSDLDVTVSALVKELEARMLLVQQEGDADLLPCHVCGSTELLRSVEPARIEVAIAAGGTTLALDIVACAACATVRLSADPKELASAKTGRGEPAFRRIEAKRPPTSGPFR